MQDIKVKSGEIIKINGKRYILKGPSIMTPGCDPPTLKEITPQEEADIIKALIEYALKKDMELKGYAEMKKGGLCISTWQDIPEPKMSDYSIKYLRAINDPTNFGLENKKDYRYFLYWNFDKDDTIHILCYDGNRLVNIIEDYREKLLDGGYIK